MFKLQNHIFRDRQKNADGEGVDAASWKLFPPSTAIGLSTLVFFEAIVACWLLAPSRAWLPLSGAVPLNLLPHFLCLLALALAVLMAPGLAAETLGGRGVEKDVWPAHVFFARACAAAGCQGLFLNYLLMIAGRVTPLDLAVSSCASACVALVALVCMLLTRIVPLAFSGIVFGWMIALPVFSYMLAELSASSIDASAGSGSQRLHVCIHWLASLAPSTAIIGAVPGILPEGAQAPDAWPWLTLCGLIILYAILDFRFGNRDK